ncbi:RNA polymerase sigma factor [Melia azedarach]|uniref:RNA polymerase sigma factor n=1 Tax=Melia azedarach TaxID=155640 RepID=A0ACC1XJD0_MELAZ|nr:RNA polymerase sigma factor [Melia azedarach]
MAITRICSSSPTHSTLPSLKTPHSLLPPSRSSSSCSNKSANTVSNGVLLIAESATEAVALASAAVRAAREAVALARGVEENWFDGGCQNMVKVRRKSRRKKMMKQCEFFNEEFGAVDDLLKSKKSLHLSPSEEAEICLCLQEGARLEEARNAIPRSQEHESISKQLANVLGIKRSKVDKILCKERESQERIIRSYRRLVVSIAAGYQGKGLSLQDLVQEGSIGLVRGVKRFNPEKGYKLSTYVYWWIKQAIIRAIANKSRIIRLPGSMCEMVAKIAEANNVLSRRLKRLPTHNEIAEMLNIHISTVRLAFERTRYPISLDGGVTDRGCMTLQNIIAGPDETRPERMVQEQQMKQELKELLRTLSDREAHILRLHFGLSGNTPKSCEEIGTILKLSRERVRQLNVIALTKLQQTSNVDNLKVYIV